MARCHQPAPDAGSDRWSAAAQYLLLLLSVLQRRNPGNPAWAGLHLAERLETKVSSGEQQRYWQEALTADFQGLPAETQNPYLRVVPLIQQLLDGAAAEPIEDRPEASFDEERFVSYLLSRVYFVVIETRATLSKTLQIFDAINTSGMDLNGGDVFKVRYYEYLRLAHQVDETEFERISDLYRTIDVLNRDFGYDVCGIEEILSLVRHLLIARHDLPKIWHDFAASVFFDRFFDTVLRVNTWPNLALDKCRQVNVSLDEIARLIDAQFAWTKSVPALGLEARVMYEFLWWSRYAKYHYLIVLFRDRFGSDAGLTERFLIQLSKVLVMYSISYKRTVYELNALLHRVVTMMFGVPTTSTAEDVIACLYQVAQDHRTTIDYAFEEYPIAENARAKSLTCRLAAFLDEREAWPHDTERLRSLLFDTEIDIEHIESVNHEDELERVRIHELWQGELHRIGNLMVLESSLNRSIKNADYQLGKIPAYRTQSLFRTVRTHADTYPTWSLGACKSRKDILKGRLVEYLCS